MKAKAVIIPEVNFTVDSLGGVPPGFEGEFHGLESAGFAVHRAVVEPAAEIAVESQVAGQSGLSWSGGRSRGRRRSRSLGCLFGLNLRDERFQVFQRGLQFGGIMSGE